jgi:hypothetical protein
MMGLALLCVAVFGLMGTWASYAASSSQQASRLAMFLALGFILIGPMLDFLVYGLVGGSSSYIPLGTLSSPMVAAWSVLSLSDTSPLQAWQFTWAGSFVLYLAMSVILWVSLRRKAEQARIA